MTGEIENQGEQIDVQHDKYVRLMADFENYKRRSGQERQRLIEAADEQVLRIAGKGMDGIHGGQKGDLFLIVKIAPHPEFHRKGNDLYRDVPVGLYTAVLGGKALVKTLKGAVKVDIPKETPNHKVLRLRGLGMPVFGRNNEYGNLFVSVDIQMVDHLTRQETGLFEKLSALRK